MWKSLVIIWNVMLVKYDEKNKISNLDVKCTYKY